MQDFLENIDEMLESMKQARILFETVWIDLLPGMNSSDKVVRAIAKQRIDSVLYAALREAGSVENELIFIKQKHGGKEE